MQEHFILKNLHRQKPYNQMKVPFYIFKYTKSIYAIILLKKILYYCQYFGSTKHLN